MTKTKTTKEVKKPKSALEEANAKIAELEAKLGAVKEPTPVPVEPEVSIEDIKDRGDHGKFTIEAKPTDSPKVRKAKLIAIFAADKKGNPERYARKNKDAELERKLKAL